MLKSHDNKDIGSKKRASIPRLDVKKLSYAGLMFACIGMMSSAANACIIIPFTGAKKLEIRKASKAVVTNADCSFENAGLWDRHSAGPAVSLGNNRFYQIRGQSPDVVSSVLVADCQEREVIGIDRYHNVRPEDSCSLAADPLPLLSPEGPLTLKEGKDLSELSRIGESEGTIVVNQELKDLLETPWGKPMPSKDRVDLLCGCRLHYPDSPGAKL